MSDMVNNPPHYRRGGIEVIDVIDALEFDFYDANAFKYLARAGHKNPDKEIEDREKSIWYQQRKLKKLKKLRDARISDAQIGPFVAHVQDASPPSNKDERVLWDHLGTIKTYPDGKL